MAKLSKELFVKALKEVFQNEGFYVTERDHQKINESYKCLAVKTSREDFVECVVNVDEIHEAYMRDKISFHDSVDLVKKAINEQKTKKLELNELKTKIENIDFVKKKLFIDVCNYDKNKDVLNNLVYRKVLDLALVVRIELEKTDSGEFHVCTVSKGFLTNYGITEEELFEMAMKNSEKIRPAHIMNMNDFIMPELKNNLTEDEMEYIQEVCDRENTFNYTVTNSNMCNGASSIFYPGVLDKIFKELGAFFVFPSSIHEVLILKCKEDYTDEDISYFKDMISSVNNDEGCMLDKDILSNSLYMYDGHELKIV